MESHGLHPVRANELCVAAINALKEMIVGRTLESFTANLGAFWHTLTGDSQAQIE